MLKRPIDFEKLRQRKRSLEVELDEIESQLGYHNPAPWGSAEWKERALSCIYKRQRYCTTIDVLKCLISLGKYERLNSELREKFVVSLSVALNGLVKAGYIKAIKIPSLNKGYYYGLPDWFEAGKLKMEYAGNRIAPILNIVNQKLNMKEEMIIQD